MSALKKIEAPSNCAGNTPRSSNATAIVVGELSLSDDTGRVTASGVPILLRPIEFRLLRFLMSHPERVHTRTELLEQAWCRKVFVGERTIDVHIRRLRVSLQPFGMDSWIKTAHTRGYRFSTQY